MSTIGELVVRIGLLLQDSDHGAWSEDQKRVQLIEEISKLSREGMFGEIVWRNAVADQAIYTLPDTTIDVYAAMYDGHTLYASTERSLALNDESWEQRAKRPQYYTDELQEHSAVRLTPAPLITGSNIPELPPSALFWTIDDNCVFFILDNPQGNGGLEQDCYVPDWLEDVLVYRSASKLCGDKGDYQDAEKSLVLDRIADLYCSVLRTDLDLDVKV